MRKAILIFAVLLFAFGEVKAQSDTIVYFFKASGQLTANKDSAEVIQIIYPPNLAVDDKLRALREYYANGKPKLIGSLRGERGNAKLDGTAMNFFPNGKRKSIITFKDGEKTGDAMFYYPNGKQYSIQRFTADQYLLINCWDSIGTQIAENGNGRWIEYNDSFTWIVKKNTVKDGIPQNDAETFFDSDPFKPKSDTAKFIPVDVSPSFRGGIEKLYKVIGANLRYPEIDKKKHVTGKVFISFIIEKDGSLSDIKAVRGPSETLMAEAVRVIKLSPPWIPGSAKGMPVRVKYTMPLAFSLSESD